MSVVPLQDLLAQLGAKLAEDPQIRLAMLFGSQATGRAQTSSDVDVAIDAPGVDRLALAATLSDHLGIDVDVVSLDEPSIPFLEELVAHALVAFESAPGLAAAWRAKALAQLETDRPWFERMRDAWLIRVAREGIADGQ